MADIGSYKTSPFSKYRNIIVETVEFSRLANNMVAFIETDVSKAMEMIDENARKTGEKTSFTAWLLYCLGEAVSKYPSVHAYRKRRKIITFEDVDISVMVLSKIDGREFPTVKVIRKVESRSLLDIHNDIRGSQHEEEKEVEHRYAKQLVMVSKVPGFIRKLFFWRPLLRNPFFRKKHAGTVIVSSIGMFGNVSGWGYSPTHYNLGITVGSITRKPKVEKDSSIGIGKFLHLTISISHDIVDGAEAARFVVYLCELIEKGYGLDKFE